MLIRLKPPSESYRSNLPKQVFDEQTFTQELKINKQKSCIYYSKDTYFIKTVRLIPSD
jgi:hypothetical protein